LGDELAADRGVQSRALFENNVERYESAAPFWGRFYERADNEDRDRFRFLACYAFARAGDHDQACREAERDKRLSPVDAVVAYDWSCVFAIAAASTLTDKGIPEPMRAELAKERADRAMTFLVLARDLELFQNTDAIDKLKMDIDLFALRERTDFKELVKPFGAGGENPPVSDGR
jgi:hypothetical protein